MDYEFMRDITGKVRTKVSMGHEAIGHWLNEEVEGDLLIVDQIEVAIADVKGSERQWQLNGREYSLLLDGEEVMIRANHLLIETDELEEGFSYYDEESLSFCGVEDFLALLKAYRSFITQY